MPNGATKIIGPVVFPATKIPAQGSYHTCLLAEVRTDNDDSAGGKFGCGVPIDPNPCTYGSYFWGNNNVCQRNLSYQSVPAHRASSLEFKFIVGSVWSTARFLEISLEPPPELLKTIFNIKIEPFTLPLTVTNRSDCDLVFVSHSCVKIRCGNCDVGELEIKPGTIWRSSCKPKLCTDQKHSQDWQVVGSNTIGFSVDAGELRLVALSFTTPKTLDVGTSALISIYQKNDKQVVTGGVFFQIDSK